MLSMKHVLDFTMNQTTESGVKSECDVLLSWYSDCLCMCLQSGFATFHSYFHFK